MIPTNFSRQFLVSPLVARYCSADVDLTLVMLRVTIREDGLKQLLLYGFQFVEVCTGVNGLC